ncbi:MAG: DNA primase, partial [Acidimicrobiia bacterium]
RRWVGLCPFHAEKTASFSVNAELGLYHCFGCQAKGDVITFLREVDHLDFVEAVERLAARAGIELRYDEAREGRDRQRRSRLIEAVEAAVEWYHQRLLTAADAAPARAYLRSRGYDGDVVRAFRLGWAPTEWDALARALRLPDDVLRDTGLGIVNRRGRQQDSFRGRVMFPILDAAGKAVAFGGRALPGDEGPKYKNSPETPIYSKSRTLYGLNWAKGEVVSTGEVVVCEGYTDVIGLAGAGVRRAVATCGTALADEHFRMLKNFARRIVLAYDADAAGQAAAERFYEWERRYEVDLFVASLPAGSDPADLAGRDPDGLRAAVADAKPFLRFRVDRVLGKGDLHTSDGRARATEAAMAVIAEHPNELVRDQYLMDVSGYCRVDPERLRDFARRGAGRAAPVRRPPPPPSRRDPGGPELEALRLAVHRRDEVVGRLHPVLFSDEHNGVVFEAVTRAATVHDAIAAADPQTADLLQRLAVEEATADVDDVLSQLLRRAVGRAVAGLEADARVAPEQALAVAAAVGWLKVTVEDLPDPDAADRLVDWLVRWSEEAG